PAPGWAGRTSLTTSSAADISPRGPICRDPVGGRVERLSRRFAGFGAPVRTHLAALGDDDVHSAPIEWLGQAAWRRGRVLLIGDAAHATSPMMGQGGSMAVEDAVVLAECLGDGTDV